MPKLRSIGSGNSWVFENAMCNFCGRKYDGYAGAAGNARVVKKALLEAIKNTRMALRNAATMDERVALTTGLHLDSLAEHIEKIGRKECDEWEIIFTLFDLIANLVGYDWLDGKTHRQLIYHQTEEQKAEDERRREPIQDIEKYVNFQYWAIAIALKCLYEHKGKSIKELALVAGVSDKWVRNRLRKYGIIEE
jgi:hypothetical protein